VFDQYNLSQTQARLISLSIAIPAVLINLMAIYGFLKLNRYTQHIKKTKEGGAYHTLTLGLMVLTFSLPLLAIMSALFRFNTTNNPGLIPSLTIIDNYISLLFPLLAFLIIAKGACELVDTLKGKGQNTRERPALLTGIILASSFTWLVTVQPLDNGVNNVYFLPNWILVITLVIPYVYVWCKGIAAAYNLYVYKKKVSGNVYRKAVGYLSYGIGIIISLSIVIQMLTTVSAQLSSLALGPILGIVYLLLGLYVLGYAMVARGARKLMLIEEA
jgi:hypothetical protein